MSKIDFNNKSFSLISNSEKGKVTNETIFDYKQQGNLVTADYHGGSILYGKIIAVLHQNFRMRRDIYTKA